VLYSERALDADSLARAAGLHADVIGAVGTDAARQTAAVDQFLARVKLGLADGASATPDSNGSTDATMPSDELQGRCVLIVDDDARNLFALTGLLENCGMHVRAADSGREALQLLADDGGIDIVLMDIMMPDLDGYDTMRLLRADVRLAGLPVIALTAKAMADDREKCLAAGASDYISKPVDTDQLLRQLAHWLSTPAAAQPANLR
jgi:CheY-like chemotaxis protein